MAFLLPSKDKKPIPLYSSEFYTACAIGGIAACGLTHTAVTPLDLVKCNMQANPKEFTGLFSGMKKIAQKKGFGGLYTGFMPTLLGYSVQGGFKFGLYEFFKHFYAGLVTEETAHKYRDLIYLSGSASAEFFADIGLSAFEATKVRVQTTLDPVTLKPTFARGLCDGMSKIVAQDGMNGLFKGIPPLWLRQIPYTMMKFFGFERSVELIYKQLSKPKDQYNKGQQLLVSFAGGYMAGVFCAIVSHPADTVVSILNKNKSATIGNVLKSTSIGTLCTKGLGPRILMIGTLTALQWFLYDSFKTYVGLPTTGGAKHAAPAKPAAPAAKPVVAAAPAAKPAPKPAAEVAKVADKAVEVAKHAEKAVETAAATTSASVAKIQESAAKITESAGNAAKAATSAIPAAKPAAAAEKPKH